MNEYVSTEAYTDAAPGQWVHQPIHDNPGHLYGNSHQECARRGCTAAPMSGSVYCTEVHERWDNPRVAAEAVSR